MLREYLSPLSPFPTPVPFPSPDLHLHSVVQQLAAPKICAGTLKHMIVLWAHDVNERPTIIGESGTRAYLSRCGVIVMVEGRFNADHVSISLCLAVVLDIERSLFDGASNGTQAFG